MFVSEEGMFAREEGTFTRKEGHIHAGGNACSWEDVHEGRGNVREGGWARSRGTTEHSQGARGCSRAMTEHSQGKRACLWERDLQGYRTFELFQDLRNLNSYFFLQASCNTQESTSYLKNWILLQTERQLCHQMWLAWDQMHIFKMQIQILNWYFKCKYCLLESIPIKINVYFKNQKIFCLVS